MAHANIFRPNQKCSNFLIQLWECIHSQILFPFQLNKHETHFLYAHTFFIIFLFIYLFIFVVIIQVDLWRLCIDFSFVPFCLLIFAGYERKS